MRSTAAVLLCLLLASCSGVAQSNTDCPTVGEGVPRSAMVGYWTWTDRTEEGRDRMWLMHLEENGQRRVLVRAYAKEGVSATDNFTMTNGTFGRWFLVGRVFSTIRDGAFQNGDPTGQKNYFIESDEPPIANSMFVGNVSTDRIDVCWGENGRRYASLRRVDADYRIPDRFPTGASR